MKNYLYIKVKITSSLCICIYLKVEKNSTWDITLKLCSNIWIDHYSLRKKFNFYPNHQFDITQHKEVIALLKWWNNAYNSIHICHCIKLSIYNSINLYQLLEYIIIYCSSLCTKWFSVVVCISLWISLIFSGSVMRKILKKYIFICLQLVMTYKVFD